MRCGRRSRRPGERPASPRGLDGSGAAFDDVLAAVEASGCLVQRHARNRGKGRALKAGLRLVAERFPGAPVVTADCDGQHTPADILRVADAVVDATATGDTIVLGVRRFDGADVPRRSATGNRMSRLGFRGMTGYEVRDTRTGLRGLPPAAIPRLLGIAGDRFATEATLFLASFDLQRSIVFAGGRPLTRLEPQSTAHARNAALPVE